LIHVSHFWDYVTGLAEHYQSKNNLGNSSNIDKDIKDVVKCLQQNDVFKEVPGRKHDGMSSLLKDLLSVLDFRDLKWHFKHG